MEAAMTQSPQTLPIFYYLIEIEDKEFPLVIMPDGMSQWEDHDERRKTRHPQDRHLELQALLGDQRACRKLRNELLEFTISVEVPKKLFLKAMKMAQEQQRVEITTAGSQPISPKTARDITEINQLLTKFFWKEVNPLLCQPIKPLP